MVPLRTLCRVDNHYTMEKCANHKLQIKSIIGAILLVALNCITFFTHAKARKSYEDICKCCKRVGIKAEEKTDGGK